MFVLTYILQLLMLHTRRYDKAKVPVPHFTAGTDVAFNITLTIDHGGQVVAPPLMLSLFFCCCFFSFLLNTSCFQAWMMFACAENISETNNWVR